jgi:SAM-dependent methyltransferase
MNLAARGAIVNNIDTKTVAGFGDEWTSFDQSALSPAELETVFAQYFAIFPWEALPSSAVGFDIGCGSGRWARSVAPRVKHLHCIDPSPEALRVAMQNLASQDNCSFHIASVDAIPLEDGTMDFGYALGVLHHIPDTAAGIRSCVTKLKPGAPLLLYIYYAFDNRPLWFRMIWKGSDAIRRVISALPYRLQYWTSFGIAAAIYWPLARSWRILERLGANVDPLPLSYYRDRSFYFMRTDARDRFGTSLEQRFTAGQIQKMMEAAGLERIRFSPDPPYWCAVGYTWDGAKGGGGS